VIALKEAECCALAAPTIVRHHCALRATRPQLKRDPLGSTQRRPMALVSPGEARATVQDGPNGLQITIPGARRRFVSLFLLAWLGGWFFGERNALRELMTGTAGEERGFLAFWLIAWTLGGLGVIYLILWSSLGRERLTLRPDALVLRREVLGIGRSREYDIRYIKDLRIAPPAAYGYRQGQQFWGLGGGRIAFDYGAKTVSFASAIDEAEAKLLVEQLRTRHPLLRATGAA